MITHMQFLAKDVWCIIVLDHIQQYLTYIVMGYSHLDS